ncbi:hypothetical protein CKAH01_04106 [Colletotrichum kahawae]|uniref:Uncharacterized protein n=1 Tax=Colletotrichum kahawae TaxID=34407 RepID=A0AAE0D8S3_COLKA|nr:hypothetical protein CKAH01_04106 [Colletotrichum kahawae]
MMPIVCARLEARVVNSTLQGASQVFSGRRTVKGAASRGTAHEASLGAKAHGTPTSGVGALNLVAQWKAASDNGRMNRSLHGTIMEASPTPEAQGRCIAPLRCLSADDADIQAIRRRQQAAHASEPGTFTLLRRSGSHIPLPHARPLLDVQYVRTYWSLQLLGWMQYVLLRVGQPASRLKQLVPRMVVRLVHAQFSSGVLFGTMLAAESLTSPALPHAPYLNVHSASSRASNCLLVLTASLHHLRLTVEACSRLVRAGVRGALFSRFFHSPRLSFFLIEVGGQCHQIARELRLIRISVTAVVRPAQTIVVQCRLRQSPSMLASLQTPITLTTPRTLHCGCNKRCRMCALAHGRCRAVRRACV